MFTGLVQEVGTVTSLEDGRLVVRCSTRAALGDSISLNGVCLTVVARDSGTLSFDVAEETGARAKPFRGRVNVEPALRAGAPLGGHYVQGHVDGVGAVAGVREDGFARLVTIEAAPDLLRYVVEKGSIAVDGVSLTVAEVGDDAFVVSLIPETLARTNLGGAAPGTPVNLEVDILAKYVEKLVAAR